MFVLCSQHSINNYHLLIMLVNSRTLTHLWVLWLCNVHESLGRGVDNVQLLHYGCAVVADGRLTLRQRAKKCHNEHGMLTSDINEHIRHLLRKIEVWINSFPEKCFQTLKSLLLVLFSTYKHLTSFTVKRKQVQREASLYTPMHL